MAPNMSLMEEKPLSWHELLAALIIFLLPLFSIFALTGLSLPEWTHYLVLILFWGTIIFALGLALIQKIPRWSLPYLGFILIVGLIMGEYYRFWVWIYPLFLNIFGPRASWSPAIQVVYACIAEALSWLAILVSALILVNLLRLLPYTRSVWQGIRNDWTQLSFLLYGTLVFYITLSFDEYRYDEIWQSAAWLCLAVGAWFYLRAKSQNRRIWALAGGSTAALWIATLAKWILVPLQAWPTGWPIAPSETSRWVETSYTFFSWIGFIFILFAPALLNLLPPRSMPTDIPEEEPIST